jgi:signal transduction histidine kinase
MRARTAWILAGVSFLLVIADVLVTAAYRPLLSEAAVAEHGFPFTDGAVLGSAVLGAVILARYERHRVGTLLSLIGVTGAFSLVAEAYSIWVISEDGPGPRGFAGLAGWLSSIFGGQLALGGLALMFLLAPDGRFLSTRWKYAAACIGVGELCCALAVGSANPTEFDMQAMDVGPVRGPLFSMGFSLVALGLLAAVVSMVVRLRQSRGEERQQVRLIALGAALVMVGVAVLGLVQAANGGQQTWAASLPLFTSYLLLPIFFAVAVLRYRLYDIDVVINWAVVLAVVTAFAGVGYVGLVVAVGWLVDARTEGLWLSLLATALVALAFQPLRRVAIGFANRLAYGPRAQPYQALSDFSSRLTETPTPTTLLQAVAEAAGRAVAAGHATASLHPPGAAIMTAAWGTQRGDATASHVVQVRHGGSTLGTVSVDVPRGRPLRASDHRLLNALADQAAVAFRNAAMEAQLAEHVADLDRAAKKLAESRSRIIAADDAVRQRLEAAIARDVMPRLVELPAQLHHARHAVGRGAGTNELGLLVDRTNSALNSLRELTRGVFPTQLSRAGVAPAVRSLLAHTKPTPRLAIDDDIAGQRFPARVEAALYYCCAEAAPCHPSAVELSRARHELVLRVHELTMSDVDLQPIVDRVEAAGGSLTVDGDLLAVRIPIAPIGDRR